MLVNMVFLFFGLLIGRFNRASLVYSVLILYTFSAASAAGTGISLYTAMNWLTVVPLFVYLIYDGVILKGFRKRNIPTGLLVSLALLFLYILLRYQSSTHPDRLDLLVTLGTCFIVFAAGVFYFEEIKAGWIFNIAGFLVLFETVLVVCQTIFGYDLLKLLFFLDFGGAAGGSDLAGSLYRATGTFSDPNYFALFMCVLVSTLFIRFKPADKLLILLGLFGTVLSFSRMGMLIGALLLVVFLVKAFKGQTRLNMFWLLFSAAAVCLFVFFIVNTSTGINSVISKIYENITYRFQDIYDFGQGGRLYIIQEYFSSILNINNFFTGLGFENFEGELVKVTGQSLVAHNEYLQIFADIGLAGLCLIGITIFAGLRNTGFRKLAGENAMLLTLVVIAIGNLFLLTTFNIYLYLFIALYMGYAYAHKKEDKLPGGGQV